MAQDEVNIEAAECCYYCAHSDGSDGNDIWCGLHLRWVKICDYCKEFAK